MKIRTDMWDKGDLAKHVGDIFELISILLVVQIASIFINWPWAIWPITTMLCIVIFLVTISNKKWLKENDKVKNKESGNSMPKV